MNKDTRLVASMIYPSIAIQSRVGMHDLSTRVYKGKAFDNNGDPIVNVKMPGRNELCPCNSGEKYKKCCKYTE